MHRDGLFFDPLQGGPDAPPAEHRAPNRGAEQPETSEHAAPQQGTSDHRAPVRHRRPDAGELQAQRQRELARVQDELRKMAQGPGPSGDGGTRSRRRRPAVDR